MYNLQCCENILRSVYYKRNKFQKLEMCFMCLNFLRRINYLIDSLSRSKIIKNFNIPSNLQ